MHIIASNPFHDPNHICDHPASFTGIMGGGAGTKAERAYYDHLVSEGTKFQAQAF